MTRRGHPGCQDMDPAASFPSTLTLSSLCGSRFGFSRVFVVDVDVDVVDADADVVAAAFASSRL